MEWMIALAGWVVFSCMLAPLIGRTLRPIGLVTVPPRPDLPIARALARR